MRDNRITTGSVVQANEWADDEWRGCLLVVDAVKDWGVEAYMSIPYRGITSMRFKWNEICYIGKARLVNELEGWN